MNATELRDLRKGERNTLKRMLQAARFDADRIYAQIEDMHVKVIDDAGSLEFLSKEEDQMELPDGPLVNAIQSDMDTVEGFGPYVNYILFVKYGIIQELQVYKDDESPIQWPFDSSKIVAVFPGAHRV